MAREVWKRFGNPQNYVEPFFGSGAVLLARPHQSHERGSETVNDLDALLSNLWRAIHYDPDGVAEHADWPIEEASLHARHLWLIGQRERISGKLMSDPFFYDVRAAGWWVWGISQWIGSGWCTGDGPWTADRFAALDGIPTVEAAAGTGEPISDEEDVPDVEGVRRRMPSVGGIRGVRAGVTRSMPRLTAAQGINGGGDEVEGVKRQIPVLTGNTGVHADPDGADVDEGDGEAGGVKWKRPHLSVPDGMGTHRKVPVLTGNTGVHRKIPEMSSGRGVLSTTALEGAAEAEALAAGAGGGNGVAYQLPSVSSIRGTHAGAAEVDAFGRLDVLGAGGEAAARRGYLRALMRRLQDRLREVRVCCGSWERVTQPSVTIRNGLTAVFLDPPYVLEGREGGLYVHDTDVAGAVREWAIANGTDPQYRIALCGYEGDYQMPADWEVLEWKAVGGYGVQGKEAGGGSSRGMENAHRERIYFSPACIRPGRPVQLGLEGLL